MSTIVRIDSVAKQKLKGDAQLEELMKVMKPRTGPAWANDRIVQRTVSFPSTDHTIMQDAVRQNDLSDLEWMKECISKSVDILEKAFQQSEREPELHNKETLVKLHFLCCQILYNRFLSCLR